MGQTLCSLMLLLSLAFPAIPNQVPQPPTKEALLVGDSVMAVMATNNGGLKLLARQHPFILRAVSCQKLIFAGCTKRAKESSLALLRANRGKFSRVVVVATGYNDFDDASFSRAIAAISTESSRQGVLVLWLTYREEGNVRKKAISYNAQLRKFLLTVPNLRLLDWNRISQGHDSWFTKDKIHMNGSGGLEMAKAISIAIDNL